MTTITVSSFKTYNRIHNYLYNKNVECWGDLENLSISFFNLTREETDALLKKLIKHFHLAPAANNRTLAA
jgi:hypothetical protein